MFDKYRKTLVAGTVAITLGLSASGVMAAGFKPCLLYTSPSPRDTR